MFRIQACTQVMPPQDRLPLRPLSQLTSQLIPGRRSVPGFDSVSFHFDPSSAVHLRSSPWALT